MLTPEEISSRQFLVQLRGYDRDEVHAFLGEVSAEIADLRSRLAELEADLEAATDPSQGAQAAPQAASETTPSELFAEIGQQTQRILEAAQEAGDEIRRKAQEDAEQARDRAVAEASGAVDAARTEAERLVAEGERRRAAVDDLVRGLAASRDRLVDDLRGVGRTVEQALRDLDASGDGPAAGSGTPEYAGPDLGAVVPAGADSAAQASPEAPTTAEVGVEETAPAPEPEVAPEIENTTPVRGKGPRQETLETVEIDLAAAPTAADEVSGDPEPGRDADVVADATTAPSEPAGDVGGLRAEALAPLHPRMVRRLQRGLQGLHDASLDRVRKSGGKGDVDALLPTRDEVGHLGRVAGEFLDQAHAAGTRAASTLAGRDLPATDAPQGLGSDFGAEALNRVHGGLREALAPALGTGAGVDALTDRVRAVFDHLKDTDTEELAATRLIAAYEAGVTDALQAGGLARERGDRPANESSERGDRPANESNERGDRPANESNERGDRPANESNERGDRPANAPGPEAVEAGSGTADR